MGFSFGLLRPSPPSLGQRVLRGVFLGALVAAFLLGAGTVLGFVEPSGGGLAGIGAFVVNFAAFVAVFVVALLVGGRLGRGRAVGG